MKHLATLEFTNVTPVWVGGPIDGATYNIIGDKPIGPWLPDAKPIIGRTRWLLRAAEASAKARLGKKPNNFKEVDNISSRLFGDIHHASKIIIRVHVEPDKDILPNNCKKCYIPYDWYTTLLKKLSNNKEVDIIGGLEVDAFIYLRKRLNIGIYRPLLRGKALRRYKKYQQKIRELQLYLPQRTLQLLMIPRVRLLLQGRDGVRKLFTHQPLPPRTLKLTLEIYERSSTGLSLQEAKLAIISIAYTLVFLGIGKAASRSFGRFFLQKAYLAEMLNDINDILQWFKEERLRSPENAIRTFKDAGEWLVKQVCELFNKQCPQYASSPRILGIPSLDVATFFAAKIAPITHPCPYALPELTERTKPGCCDKLRQQVKEIHEALSAVGKATMKATWKICAENDVTKPGPGYHTWVLGLPREGKYRIREYGEFITGYQVADVSEWATHEQCYNINIDEVTVELSSTRRASPMLVTTYCYDKPHTGCYALLEPFITLDDFVSLLVGEYGPLVHVGIHDTRRTRTRTRQSPGPVIHIIGVYKIATKPTVGLNNCPEKGNIAYPPSLNVNAPPPRSPEEVVQRAFNAAMSWLKSLLH